MNRNNDLHTPMIHRGEVHDSNNVDVPTDTPLLKNVPLVSREDMQRHYEQSMDENRYDNYADRQVNVRHRQSDFDDFDRINPDSNMNRNERDGRFKKLKRAVGVIALSVSLVGGAGAVYYHVPDVAPSDKTVTIHKGDVMWDDYEDLAQDWNSQHPDKRITVDTAEAYFNEVNGGKDKRKPDQPGDTYVVPKLTERTPQKTLHDIGDSIASVFNGGNKNE